MGDTAVVWKDLGIITPDTFIDSMNPPPKVGRIPCKIQSAYSGTHHLVWHSVLPYGRSGYGHTSFTVALIEGVAPVWLSLSCSRLVY